LDKGEKKEGGSISSLQADSIPLGEAQDRLRQAQDSAQVRRSLDGIKEKKSAEIINKTLRSGQKVEHDGDVFIMGDVNPNSYVIASGNIIVMGTLRGIVHAGASGDETAFVMALKLKPQQLRIGSFFTRAPDNIEDPEYPEKAFVKDNQIYIEKFRHKGKHYGESYRYYIGEGGGRKNNHNRKLRGGSGFNRKENFDRRRRHRA
jgi:septum site-determining protein MinC